MQTRFTRRHVLQFGLILGFVATLGRAPVFAASEQDAKDMVARAIKLFDEQGEAAFDVFNQGEAGGFLVGDLYIVIQGTGPGEKVIASAAQPSLAGTPLADIVDVTGDRFAVRISAEATEDGSWFEYQWNDPAVGKVRKKKAWAVRHKGFIFLCGIYE